MILEYAGLTQHNSINTASDAKKLQPSITSAGSVKYSTGQNNDTEPEKVHNNKDAKVDGDTEDISPIIVKSEPEEGMLGMYEDVSQMMTMETEEYEGHYGDQEYDSSVLVAQEPAFQDPTKVQCDICFKLIHKNTMNRHKRDRHGKCAPVQCHLCEKIFKNETSFKGHLRQSHNIYQTNPQDGAGNPVIISTASIS